MFQFSNLASYKVSGLAYVHKSKFWLNFSLKKFSARSENKKLADKFFESLKMRFQSRWSNFSIFLATKYLDLRMYLGVSFGSTFRFGILLAEFENENLVLADFFFW